MKIQGIQNQTSFNGVVNISENLSPKMRNEISKSLKTTSSFTCLANDTFINESHPYVDDEHDIFHYNDQQNSLLNLPNDVVLLYNQFQ